MSCGLMGGLDVTVLACKKQYAINIRDSSERKILFAVAISGNLKHCAGCCYLTTAG